MVLPKQARDGHTENSQKRTPFEQGVRKDYYNPFGMFYNCSVAANTCLYLRANHNLLGAANRPSLVSLTEARKYVDGLHATLRAAAAFVEPGIFTAKTLDATKPLVTKRPLCSHLLCKTDHFTKTDSGQT